MEDNVIDKALVELYRGDMYGEWSNAKQLPSNGLYGLQNAGTEDIASIARKLPGETKRTEAQVLCEKLFEKI